MTRLYERLLYSLMGCRSADEALSAETNLLRTILVSLPICIYVKDLNSRLVLSNPAHLHVLGCRTLEEALGKTDLDFFPHEQAIHYQMDERAVMQSGLALLNREEPVTCASGEQLWALTTKVPLRDREGKIYGLVGVTRDITERKRAEEELQRAYDELERKQGVLNQTLKELESSHAELSSTQLQLIHAARLESVGVLSAAVAHEVKNPLQTILMGLDYLDANLVAGTLETPCVLRDMREAVTRAKTILGELLHLASGTNLVVTRQDLNSVVQRALWLMRFDMLRTQIQVITELAPERPYVMVDKSKLEQVLINLLSNSVQAMPSGGTLIVRTRATALALETQKLVPELVALKPGQSILLVEVQDTGTGISEKDLPKLFDPFFTTKPPGVGTGLGLSVTRKIMELHGGAVRIENVAPRGVRATLFLKGVTNES